jgi:hypothetical protein
VRKARHYLAEGVEHIYMIDQVSYRDGSGQLQLGRTARELELRIPNRTKHIMSPPLASEETVNQIIGKTKITHLSVSNMVIYV